MAKLTYNIPKDYTVIDLETTGTSPAKNEIIEIAEKINTFETSIQPFEDCCTIFVAKHPVTKPNISKMEASEKKLEEKIHEMVKKAIEEREVILVKPE